MTIEHPRRQGDGFEYAARYVRLAAEPIARKFGLLRANAAEQELAHVLRVRLPFKIGSTKIVQAQYSLRVESEDQESARRRLALLDRKFLESLERERIRAEISFVREVVMKDPANAEIYKILQLSKGVQAVHGTPYDQLAKLCAEWSPEGRWVLIARIIHEFLRELRPEAKEDFVAILQACLEASGRQDLVREVGAATRS
ncbi:hypothetical protein AB0J14_20200 [Micromonospora arborensis]|uniref:hypothetical protein n=1 Tax=Micromonospora arborensis TaxID=2116518 RepID=UPI0033C20B08